VLEVNFREPHHFYTQTQKTAYTAFLRLTAVQSQTEVRRTSEGDWIWVNRTPLVSSTPTRLFGFL
jgi:hypothetical protein